MAALLFVSQSSIPFIFLNTFNYLVLIHYKRNVWFLRLTKKCLEDRKPYCGPTQYDLVTVAKHEVSTDVLNLCKHEFTVVVTNVREINTSP